MFQELRVKTFVVLSPKNLVYFTKKQFKVVADESTIFIDDNGVAYGENEMHIYVCEDYGIPNTKKRK